MGAKTMFDLSKSLCDWQEQLRQGEGCSQDDIDELEEHLRDEMAALAQAGLSGEETFLLATRRLGKVDLLKEEFEKVNAPLVWWNRLRWMAMGVLIYLGASTAEVAFRQVLVVGAAAAGLNSYVVGILIPLARVGIMALIVVLAVKVVSHRTVGSQGTHSCTRATKRGVLLGVLLWFTLLPIGQWTMLSLVIGGTHVRPEDMGRISMAVVFGESVLSVVLPLVIAGWLLKPRQWSY
jgi:hypothetical protein